MTLSRTMKTVLKSDLVSFLHRVFQTVDGGPFVPKWYLELLAYELEKIRNGSTKRLCICMPPRSLKTLAATVAHAAWRLGHNPKLRIVIVSYSMDLTSKLARDIRSVLESEWYRAVFPGTRLSRRKNTEFEFETTHGGYILGTSVGGTLTGRGADLIIVDDPLKANEGLSDERRRSTNQWFFSTLVQRLNNKNTGAIIVVAQRLHVDDLVGQLQEHGWDTLAVPAIAEERSRYEIGPGRFHERTVGDILIPELAAADTLERTKRDVGSYHFASQYQQQPIPPGGNIVQRGWLQRYIDPPEYVTGTLIVQSWDPASQIHDDASYSVCTTWAVVGRRYYLLHVLRARLAYPELKRTVIEHARRHRADIILIEHTSTGLPLIQDLAVMRLPGFKTWKPRGDKLSRIEAQSAKFEAGQVIIPTEAPWLDEFLRELLSYPASKHSDQVDSVSQFLEWIALRERRFHRVRPNPIRPRGYVNYYRAGRGWPNLP